MSSDIIWYWTALGVALMIAEAILPGLVSVFLGLAALTVALLLKLQIIGNFAEQLIAWFGISTFYIFSLRLIAIRFYPSDKFSGNIDEDQQAVGQHAMVTAAIPSKGVGRIHYADSTWPASSVDGLPIPKNEVVEIASRDNISWKVKRLESNHKKNSKAFKKDPTSC